MDVVAPSIASRVEQGMMRGIASDRVIMRSGIPGTCIVAREVAWDMQARPRLPSRQKGIEIGEAVVLFGKVARIAHLPC